FITFLCSQRPTTLRPVGPAAMRLGGADVPGNHSPELSPEPRQLVRRCVNTLLYAVAVIVELPSKSVFPSAKSSMFFIKYNSHFFIYFFCHSSLFISKFLIEITIALLL